MRIYSNLNTACYLKIKKTQARVKQCFLLLSVFLYESEAIVHHSLSGFSVFLHNFCRGVASLSYKPRRSDEAVHLNLEVVERHDFYAPFD